MFLYYDAVGYLRDIRLNNDSNKMNSVEITEKEKDMIFEKIENGYIFKYDIENNKIAFEYDNKKRRLELVEQREVFYDVLDEYYLDRIINDKGLTEDQLLLRDSYREDLKDLSNAFDLCLDKENFKYIFVEEKSYSEFTEDMTIYEIVKPDFIV